MTPRYRTSVTTTCGQLLPPTQSPPSPLLLLLLLLLLLQSIHKAVWSSRLSFLMDATFWMMLSLREMGSGVYALGKPLDPFLQNK